MIGRWEHHAWFGVWEVDTSEMIQFPSRGLGLDPLGRRRRLEKQEKVDWSIRVGKIGYWVNQIGIGL